MRNLILKHSKKFSTFIFTLTSVQLKFHPFPVWEVVDMNRRWWLSFHPFMRTRIVLQTQRAGSSFCFYTLWQFKWEHLLAESNRTGTISLTFQLRQQQNSRIEMKTSLFFSLFYCEQCGKQRVRTAHKWRELCWFTVLPWGRPLTKLCTECSTNKKKTKTIKDKNNLLCLQQLIHYECIHGGTLNSNNRAVFHQRPLETFALEL